MAGFDLERFRKAQEADYALALEEIKEGQKRSHWIWYIFPQLKGLGFSGMSGYFGISGIAEAKAYMRDPVLGKRLLEISGALLVHTGKNISAIFGYPDDRKVRSCMTLFSIAEPDEEIFRKVIDGFYGGEKDERTIQILKAHGDI